MPFKAPLQGDRAILMACIGIALVFWLLVKLSQPYRSQKKVNIETVFDEDMALLKVPPQNIMAELEGTGWDLMFDYLNRTEVNLHYDLRNLSQLSLSSSQLRAAIKNNLHAKNLRVVDVNHDNINLVLEQKSSKKVPVRIMDSLSFEAGYHLKSPLHSEPDSIAIEGPISLIEPLTTWNSEAFILLNMQGSVSKALKLQQPPPVITLSQQEIVVDIEVEPLTEKVLYVPILVRNAPDSLKIFPDKVTVTCKVGLSRYDLLKYTDFSAEVDLANIVLDSPNNTTPIALKSYPEYIKGLYYSPKAAKFFIIEKEEEKEDPAE
jgi:hypothetical protein